MTTFLVILGAILIIVLMFFIFKWINRAKLKSATKTIESLTDQVFVLDKQKKGFEKKIKQMNRERKASGNHMSRLVRTQEETETLHRKIDRAHTDEEIMELMSYIDEDNNSVIEKG